MTNTKKPVVVAVLHELLKSERFDCYADAVESLKCRCARLRIPYDATAIGDAIRAVEHTGRQLVAPGHSGRAPLRLAAPTPLHPAPLDRSEARELYARLVTAARRGDR